MDLRKVKWLVIKIIMKKTKRITKGQIWINIIVFIMGVLFFILRSIDENNKEKLYDEMVKEYFSKADYYFEGYLVEKTFLYNSRGNEFEDFNVYLIKMKVDSAFIGKNLRSKGDPFVGIYSPKNGYVYFESFLYSSKEEYQKYSPTKIVLSSKTENVHLSGGYEHRICIQTKFEKPFSDIDTIGSIIF